MNATTANGNVRLWVAGDWNGFFGLFTNVLLNVIVLTGLCLGRSATCSTRTSRIRSRRSRDAAT